LQIKNQSKLCERSNFGQSFTFLGTCEGLQYFYFG
jgi:hypothetical protein